MLRFISYSYIVLSLYYWHHVLGHRIKPEQLDINAQIILGGFVFPAALGIFLVAVDIIVSFHYRKYLFHHWKALILVITFIIAYVMASYPAGNWYLNIWD
jgi:hypothetical protein